MLSQTSQLAYLKQQFPLLHKKIYGKPLVYLDNAATTQKPQCVIDAIVSFYENDNANIHRGMHGLASTATQSVEQVRSALQQFINASLPEEIIFGSGTTLAINLVANSYGRTHVHKGDEVLVSSSAHHSNLLPWLQLCASQGAVLKQIPITKDGCIDIQAFSCLLSPRTKIVAVDYVSNTLGTINPIQKIVQMAHTYSAVVVVDAAQAVPHFKVDVQSLGCDFLAFSGHKLYGPTGIGVLYGKRQILEKMPPYLVGGGMVRSVHLDRVVYEDVPYRFEVGTPHIAGIIGLGAALDFLMKLGYNKLQQHEKELLIYVLQQLSALPHVRLLGTATPKVGIVSFVVDSMHSLDVGIRLDAVGVAVRTGDHCSQPLIQKLNLVDGGVVRISLAVYNTYADIDVLVQALSQLRM